MMGTMIWVLVVALAVVVWEARGERDVLTTDMIGMVVLWVIVMAVLTGLGMLRGRVF